MIGAETGRRLRLGTVWGGMCEVEKETARSRYCESNVMGTGIAKNGKYRV